MTFNHGDHIIAWSPIKVIAPDSVPAPLKIPVDFSIFLFFEKLVYVQINGTIIIIIRL